jgi:hypothetical protein
MDASFGMPCKHWKLGSTARGRKQSSHLCKRNHRKVRTSDATHILGKQQTRVYEQKRANQCPNFIPQAGELHHILMEYQPCRSEDCSRETRLGVSVKVCLS